MKNKPLYYVLRVEPQAAIRTGGRAYYRIFHNSPKRGKGPHFEEGELYPAEDSENYCEPGVEVITEAQTGKQLRFECLPNFLFCVDEFEEGVFEC